MPPFAPEPAEQRRRAVVFLEQCLQDPTVSTPSTPRLFGAESAERGGKRPNRQLNPSKNSHLKRQPAPGPFQEEGEEQQGVPKRVKTPATSLVPFQSEAAEDDFVCETDSSDSNCGDQRPKDTVFALGWQSAQQFTASGFWKENADEVTERPKRAYDNTRRKAAAAYSRQGKEGFYKANGIDQNRLEKLFESPSCSCA